MHVAWIGINILTYTHPVMVTTC